MKPSARKKRDHVFSVFHQLNLKDAMNYVADVRLFSFFSYECSKNVYIVTNLGGMFQGERRGSLEFVRNERPIVDFKKKFGIDHHEVIPHIMPDASEAHVSVPDMR